MQEAKKFRVDYIVQCPSYHYAGCIELDARDRDDAKQKGLNRICREGCFPRQTVKITKVEEVE